MHRPLTDDELASVAEVSAEEITAYRRNVLALFARTERLGIPRNAFTGIAFLRAACQSATVIGLSPSACVRMAFAACEMYPVHGPMCAAILDVDPPMYPLARRLAHITGGVLGPQARAVDAIHTQIICGVAMLRFQGHPDSLIAELLAASFADAERASAENAHRRGARA